MNRSLFSRFLSAVLCVHLALAVSFLTSSLAAANSRKSALRKQVDFAYQYLSNGNDLIAGISAQISKDTDANDLSQKLTEEQFQQRIRQKLFAEYQGRKNLSADLAAHLSSNPEMRKKYGQLFSMGTTKGGIVDLTPDLLNAFLKKNGVTNTAAFKAKFPELLALVNSEMLTRAYRIMFRFQAKDSEQLCLDAEVSEAQDSDVKWVVSGSNRSGNIEESFDAMVPDSSELGASMTLQRSHCKKDCRPDPNASPLNPTSFVCKTLADWKKSESALEEAKRITHCGLNPNVAQCQNAETAVVDAILGAEGVKGLYQTSLDGLTKDSNDFLLDTFVESYIQSSVLNAAGSSDGKFTERRIAELTDRIGSLLKPGSSCMEATSKKVTTLRPAKSNDGFVNETRNSFDPEADARNRQRVAHIGEVLKRFQTIQATAPNVHTSDFEDEHLGNMGKAAECMHSLSKRLDKINAVLSPRMASDFSWQLLPTPSSTPGKLANMTADTVLMILPPVAMSKAILERITLLDLKVGEARNVHGQLIRDMCGGWTPHFDRNAHQASHKDQRVSIDGQTYTFPAGSEQQKLFCEAAARESVELIKQMTDLYNRYPVLFTQVNGNKNFAPTAVELAARKSKKNGYSNSAADVIMQRYLELGGKPDPGVRDYRYGSRFWRDPYKDSEKDPHLKRPCWVGDKPLIDDYGHAITATDCAAKHPGAREDAGSVINDDPDRNVDGTVKSCMASRGNPKADAKLAKAAGEVMDTQGKEPLGRLADTIEDVACGRKSDHYRDLMLKSPELTQKFFSCTEKPFGALTAITEKDAKFYRELSARNGDPDYANAAEQATAQAAKTAPWISGPACYDRQKYSSTACIRRNGYTDSNGTPQIGGIAQEETVQKAKDKANASKQESWENAMTLLQMAGMLTPMGGTFKPAVGTMVIGSAVGAGFGAAATAPFLGFSLSKTDIAKAELDANFNINKLHAGVAVYDELMRSEDELRKMAQEKGKLGPLTEAILMGAAMGSVGGAFHGPGGGRALKLVGMTDDEVRNLAKHPMLAKDLDAGGLTRLYEVWSEAIKASPDHAPKFEMYQQRFLHALDSGIKKKFGIEMTALTRISVADRIAMLKHPGLDKIPAADVFAMFVDPATSGWSIDQKIKLYTEHLNLKMPERRIAVLDDLIKATTDKKAKKSLAKMRDWETRVQKNTEPQAVSAAKSDAASNEVTTAPASPDSTTRRNNPDATRKDSTTRDASWADEDTVGNPAQRSTRSAPTPDTTPVTPPRPGIEVKSTPDTYWVVDPKNRYFQATGTVDEQGVLNVLIRTENNSGSIKSDVLRGRVEYENMLKHFGSKVKAIRGNWKFGTNLGEVNKLTQPPHSLPLQEAVKQTWTAKRAADAGYSEVSIEESSHRSGKYTDVVVVFRRPKTAAAPEPKLSFDEPVKEAFVKPHGLDEATGAQRPGGKKLAKNERPTPVSAGERTVNTTSAAYDAWLSPADEIMMDKLMEKARIGTDSKDGKIEYAPQTIDQLRANDAPIGDYLDQGGTQIVHKVPGAEQVAKVWYASDENGFAAPEARRTIPEYILRQMGMGRFFKSKKLRVAVYELSTKSRRAAQGVGNGVSYQTEVKGLTFKQIKKRHALTSEKIAGWKDMNQLMGPYRDWATKLGNYFEKKGISLGKGDGSNHDIKHANFMYEEVSASRAGQPGVVSLEALGPDRNLVTHYYEPILVDY